MSQIPKEMASLTLENLDKLSQGRLSLAVNSSLRQVLVDTDDRGGDMKPRKVAIVIEIGRVKHDSSEIYIDSDVKVTMPTMSAGGTIGRLVQTGNGKVEAWFRPESPDNPDQQTIPWPERRHPEAPDEE